MRHENYIVRLKFLDVHQPSHGIDLSEPEHEYNMTLPDDTLYKDMHGGWSIPVQP